MALTTKRVAQATKAGRYGDGQPERIKASDNWPFVDVFAKRVPGAPSRMPGQGGIDFGRQMHVTQPLP